MRDITEQKRLEGQLLHAQKMEAIGRLAGGIAHDFNNLLTVIHGSVAIGKGSLPADHPGRRSFDLIEEAGRHTGHLTRQLLAFARRQVIEPRIVDLNDVISNLRTLLERLIGENVALVMIPSRDPARVRVDPGQLEQVVMNLAVNARDAMPGGGTLTIETRCAEALGEGVVLLVRDTGVGMSDDVKSRVFEPFFTTKEFGAGTGLGLATCYGIVTQGGGQITVESSPGAGTTFRIVLPRRTHARTSKSFACARKRTAKAASGAP